MTLKLISLVLFVCVLLCAQDQEHNQSQVAAKPATKTVNPSDSEQRLKSELHWTQWELFGRRMIAAQQDLQKAQDERFALAKEMCGAEKIPVEKCSIDIASRTISRVPDPPATK